MATNRLTSVFNHIGKTFIIILSILSISLTAEAQNQYASIKLKSGLTIKGKVVEMDLQKMVKLEVPGGGVVEIDVADIDEIDLNAAQTDVYNQPKPKYKIERPNFKEKGYYVTTGLGFPLGLDTWGDPSMGLSFQVSGGYTFNQHVALGLATGSDVYWWPTTSITPIALEFKGRLNKTSFSPTYGMQAGYGLVTYTDWWNSDTKGGLFLSPTFGFSSKRTEHAIFGMSVGLRSQAMTVVSQNTIFNGTEFAPVEETRDIRYNRFDLRFYLTFE